MEGYKGFYKTENNLVVRDNYEITNLEYLEWKLNFKLINN